jgi:hypothetical protein
MTDRIDVLGVPIEEIDYEPRLPSECARQQRRFAEDSPAAQARLRAIRRGAQAGIAAWQKLLAEQQAETSTRGLVHLLPNPIPVED